MKVRTRCLFFNLKNVDYYYLEIEEEDKKICGKFELAFHKDPQGKQCPFQVC